MHSRIFELSEKPVKEEDRIDEDSIIADYDGPPSWADYVMDVKDDGTQDSIGWICEHLGIKHYRKSKEPGRGFFKTEEVITALKIVVKKDIETAKPKMDELIAKLGKGDYKGLHWQILDIRDQLDSRSGFHYYLRGKDDNRSGHVGGNLGLLDSLLCGRYGNKLYVGGIVDYHS